MNKKLILILSGVLALVIIGGIAVYMATSTPEGTDRDVIAEEDYIDITPEDLGFSYELRENGTGILLIFDTLDDIVTLEYDLSYRKEIEGRDGPVEAPGGVPGEFDVSEKSTFEADIDFGTCSSGRCVFDNIISEDINLVVRAELKNGEVGLFEESIPLE